MANATQYKDLQDFLSKHAVQKGDNKPITNTRIGEKALNIYGGSYHISDEEYPTFLRMYYDEIVAGKKKEYLTEKQRDKDGPILSDIDLRYAYEVDERQYTIDHVEDFVDIYLDEIKQVFQLDDDTAFPVYIYQKPTVNRIKEKNITKDGIHMIIGLQADHIVQQILRQRVMKRVSEAWAQLPITNTWEDIFDKGISAGTTNWQLYGSRKPNNDKYQLTHVYNIGFDTADGECTRKEVSLSSFDMKKNMHLMSVRYAGHLSLFMKNSFMAEYEDFKNKLGGGGAGDGGRGVGRLGGRIGGASAAFDVGAYDINVIRKIKNQEELDELLNAFLDGLSSAEHELRDAYEYAMILPPEYYDQGSYSKWSRLCWALRNTSNKLLIVFAKVSSKASNFHYLTNMSEVCDRWLNTDLKISHGLTKRSLINWAKTDAKKEDYEKVKMSSIDTFIEETIKQSAVAKKGGGRSSGCGDFDLANVLYHHNKDLYVCASVKSNIWYEFKKHRWQELDSGTSLRKKISTEMRDMYQSKSFETLQRITALGGNPLDEVDEATEQEQKKESDLFKNRANAITDIMKRLVQTNDKKNIMTEAKELFYDGTFLQKMDINPYLICFKNGVFDFKEKVFRNGHPEDNISMCTNIDYIKVDPSVHQSIIDEINDFMNKLFPIPELCQYMWDHLASCMVGTCLNQTFNIYIGVGQNGKSVLINLMEKVLGDYKGDVPLSLVTEKRGKVGGLAPEIVQLKGKRFAVMQEPSKGDKINEGMMKQLTSGKDPIQGRAPYMPMTISFMPQFNLVVTANVFMKIESNDHGTWRRIRAVPFLSLFTENPKNDDPEKPYQFPIDKNIDEKFDSWKEVFASMLIDRVCKTGGIVTDCAVVMEKSAEYRKSQDFISEFIQEFIVRDKQGVVKKTELNNEFSLWYTNNYGGKAAPPKDLHDQMCKEFGRQKNGVWYGVKIVYSRKQEQNIVDDETTVDDDDIDDGDL